MHHKSFTKDDQTQQGVMVRLYAPSVLTVAVLLLLRWLAPDAVDLDGDLGGSVIAALTLFSGLLFALGVGILEKAIDIDLAGPEPGRTTTTAALRLQALSANALFSSLLSGLVAAMFIMASLVPAIACPTVILAIGLIVAVGRSAVAVAGRVFAETTERTERARTGVSQDQRRRSDG